jgi:phage major head subunit gpT-like protein
MAQDIILPEFADAAFQNFNTAFRRGLRAGATWARELATFIPSDTEEEIHEWLQMIPGLEEWVTERNASTLAASGYRLKNKDWNRDVKISRNKFLDDKLGLYGPTFEMLGQQASKLHDRRLARGLKRGHLNEAESLCYDGKPFFATDHPVDPNDPSKGNFSNLLALALTGANFNTAYKAFLAFTLEDGEPLGIMPTHLCVGPALREAAVEICKSAIVASGNAGVSNVNQGVVEPKVIPELGGSAEENRSWYLECLGAPIKPQLVQERQAARVDVVFDQNSEHCKKHKELVYGAEARGNYGWSFPQLAIKSIGPG